MLISQRSDGQATCFRDNKIKLEREHEVFIELNDFADCVEEKEDADFSTV